ncbi:GFA family protein [Acuticoccus kandeliae]|uniref:GFA family protein n=1 Tax=Acuticoccus kandeliae TaxID=2073160 RepID=UPI000D3EB30D|nr:GFA family protein [Acuticoccus kandeliae]
MKVDGRCHCGQITYEAEIDPDAVMICHCSDCQALSGSAFRTVALTRPGGFWLRSGELKTYVKIADSGARRLQTFCPNCGSPIHAASEGEEPKVYSLRLGTCTQRADLVPVAQIWSRSALDWLGGLESIPRRAKR